MDIFSLLNRLYLKILRAKLHASKIRIISNHQVLNMRALAEDDPKSFSINVAYAIETAKIKSPTAANLIEDKKLIILLVIVILLAQNYNFVSELNH